MKALYRKIAQIMRNKKIKRRLTGCVSVIAAVLVFFTTYATVLPAITLEKTASCGIEEHQHDDSCYKGELSCGQEESDGHQHDDSCYTVTKELVCQEKEHQHSEENGCYDEEGNLICKSSEHVHDDSCYEEVETLTCDQEESKGHHHTDACYEKVLVCGKEAHTHGTACYDADEKIADETTEDTSAEEIPENAAADNSAPSGAELKTEEAQPGNYVPELDSVEMEAVLGKHTGFYYYHPEEGEEVPESSTEITDWQELKDDTVLASGDLVRVYLPYSIPAGSLNATNPVAQYRLPENIHLTDKQIKAINKNKNGFYNDIKDSDEDADKYLGAEAIEGDRRPDEELNDDAQEYISAIVRVKESSNGDQNLIFTFVPYTIEKNQAAYDEDRNLVSAGEVVTGWFACDFSMEQIDWVEKDSHQEINFVDKETKKTAEIIFSAEDKEKDIEEISCTLNLVEKSPETEENENEDVNPQTEEFKSGTLTANGKDYTIILDYAAEAKIPENAELSVREITEQSDRNAYYECLTQAEDHVAESGEKQTCVDKAATRFFDIEIIIKDEDGTAHKIEPEAPVNVRIQIPETASNASSSEESKQDPTVLHFSEQGLETVDSTTVETSEKNRNSKEASNNKKAEEIHFEAESFSVYGVVYTVDFEYVISGESYTYKMPGGSVTSLRTLVDKLHVLDEVTTNNGSKMDADMFIENVDSVVFSDDSLIKVVKVGNKTTAGALIDSIGVEPEYSKELSEQDIAEMNAAELTAPDWALISLKSFSSYQTLAVKMKNGTVWYVKVTDAVGDSYVIHWDFYAGWLPINATINLKYIDTLRRDLSEVANGSINVSINNNQNIRLDQPPYKKDISGYTFSRIQYNGKEITRIQAEEENGWFVTNHYLNLYNGNTLVDRINMNIYNNIDIEVVYSKDSVSPEGGGTIPLPAGLDPNSLPPASAEKKLVPNLKDAEDPNSGDGTYTLTLSVKIPEREAEERHNANIVVIYDSSNSMNDYIEYEQNYNGEYGSWDGEHFDKIWFDGYNSRLFYPETGEYPVYNGPRYSPNYEKGTRMSVAKPLVKDLGEKLLKNNQTYGEGTVEIAFVEFGTTLLNSSGDTSRKTQDPAVFDGWIEQCTAPTTLGSNHAWKGATNWDLALKTANNINFGDDDQTYIVFISDGNPTVRTTTKTTDDGTRLTDNNGRAVDGIYGTGNSDNLSHNFNDAENQAVRIAESGKVIFNIGIFGDATRMSAITNHGYFDATDEAGIKSAFEHIVANISGRLGYGDVKITDGITSMTSSTLVPGESTDFTYKVVDKDGNDITNDALTDAQKNAGYTEVDKYLPHNYSYKEKTVTWDLGDNKLIDGATYSVSFIVWPDQDAYDLVADLNNGKRDFAGLNEDEKRQVVKNGDVYSLLTNTDAFVKYTPVKEVTDSEGNTTQEKGDERTINLMPPEPMDLTDATVKVQKKWNVSLSEGELAEFLENHPDYKVQLVLKKVVDPNDPDYGTVNYLTGITINPIADQMIWPELDSSGKEKDHHISTGLMVSEDEAASKNINVSGMPSTIYQGKTYYILETGRDYYFDEVFAEGEEKDYHFELEEEIFHPMVVDGELKRVTFDENGNVDNIGSMTTLTATNTLRGGINLKKEIVDKDGHTISTDKGTSFKIHGSIYRTQEGNKVGTEITYRLIGEEYTDEDGNPGRSVKKTIADSKEFEISMHAEDTIRFTNVPSGYTYEFYEETAEGDIYSFKSIEGSVTIDGNKLPDSESGISVAVDHDGNTVLTATTKNNAQQDVLVKNTPKLGALKLTKIVQVEGNAPESAGDKELVDGDYLFRVSSGNGVVPATTKYVQITVANGTASSYKIADTEEGLASANSVAGNWALVKDLPVGDYTITETGKNGLMLVSITRGDNNTSVVDLSNSSITVNVTANDENAANGSAQATFTNNHTETYGPDKIALDVEKVFSGLATAADIPQDFKVVVGYTLDGVEKEIILWKGQNEVNSDEIKIVDEGGDFTLSWHITNIPTEATSFKIKEQSYDNVPEYNFDKATLNKEDITATAGNWHDIVVTVPTVTMKKVTNQRITPDSSPYLTYALEKNDVVLIKLTSSNGTLIVSDKALNKLKRDAIENNWPQQGGFPNNKILYYSFDDHPNGFTYEKKQITFSRSSDGKLLVTLEPRAFAQKDVFELQFESNAQLNDAALTNTYSVKQVPLKIVKVRQDNSEIKLVNAQFTIRKIKDTLSANDVEYDGPESEPITTDGNGEASFANITKGYYEVRETKVPDGYVVIGDKCFYIKVDNGVISLLEKDLSKPNLNDWTATKTQIGNVSFTAASGNTAATAQVGNTPGSELPSTGGPGTRPFTILGTMLITFGAAMLLFRRQTR